MPDRTDLLPAQVLFEADDSRESMGAFPPLPR
jgi:hypothetical protein